MDEKRVISDLSRVSTASTTLSEAAERADLLCELITRASEIKLANETPQQRLARHLSLRSVVSTSSSFSQRQQAAATAVAERPASFKLIGWGSCGSIFEIPGEDTILKKAKILDSDLHNDCLMHREVFTCIQELSKLPRFKNVPRVPRPFGIIARNNQAWWANNGSRFPTEEQTRPTALLQAERILPLPKQIREDFINLYCAPHLKKQALESPGNKDCLARLYLGKRRTSARPSMFFNLRNFNLHLDQAYEIGLDIREYTISMALGLANCHWKAKVDANDIEFVLGSAPTVANVPDLTIKEERELLLANASTSPSARVLDFHHRIVYLWMLDFDKCRSLEWDEKGMLQAVEAVERNDPYFPKPGTANDNDIWTIFGNAYLNASVFIAGESSIGSDRVKALAIFFLNKWAEKRASK